MSLRSFLQGRTYNKELASKITAPL